MIRGRKRKSVRLALRRCERGAVETGWDSRLRRRVAVTAIRGERPRLKSWEESRNDDVGFFFRLEFVFLVATTTELLGGDGDTDEDGECDQRADGAFAFATGVVGCSYTLLRFGLSFGVRLRCRFRAPDRKRFTDRSRSELCVAVEVQFDESELLVAHA